MNLEKSQWYSYEEKKRRVKPKLLLWNWRRRSWGGGAEITLRKKKANLLSWTWRNSNVTHMKKKRGNLLLWTSSYVFRSFLILQRRSRRRLEKTWYFFIRRSWEGARERGAEVTLKKKRVNLLSWAWRNPNVKNFLCRVKKKKKTCYSYNLTSSACHLPMKRQEEEGKKLLLWQQEITPCNISFNTIISTKGLSWMELGIFM